MHQRVVLGGGVACNGALANAMRARTVLGLALSAAALLGAAHSHRQALADAAANKPQAFPLRVSVSITQNSKWKELISPNVAAILPGSDPQLKDEYVIFTAHLDHLGIGDGGDGE